MWKGSEYTHVNVISPDSKSGKCFLLYLYRKTPIQIRPHKENVPLQNIHKNLLGRVLDFESLKPFHTYIDKISKCIQQVKFK